MTLMPSVLISWVVLQWENMLESASGLQALLYTPLHPVQQLQYQASRCRCMTSWTLPWHQRTLLPWTMKPPAAFWC